MTCNSSDDHKDWVDLVLNTTGIREIYGAQRPSLSGADLHEIRLDRHATSALIRCDLADYPANPPRKYSQRGCNTVQIVLALSEISSLSITGWASTMSVDLAIEPGPDGFTLTCRAVPQLDITARWITLTKISAHRNALRGTG